MLVNGKNTCSCRKKKCVRYGDCEKCMEYHRTSARYPEPYCRRNYKNLKANTSEKDNKNE